jgi:hypothetical protein
MRKALGLIVVAALLVAACGDDDGGGFADPASLDTCADVADAATDVLQETIDIMDAMEPEDLLALATTEGTPEAFQEVEAQGTALQARSAEIGCSDEEFSSLVSERAQDLSADSELGRVILEAVRAGDTTSLFP